MEGDKLDFAYRYPFSEDAKSIIREMSLQKVDRVHLTEAKEHIDSILKSKDHPFTYTESGYIKKDYLLTYLYSRMLVSASSDPWLTDRFASAEAKRSTDSIRIEPEASKIHHLCLELGLNIGFEGDLFSIDFINYIKNRPNLKEFYLVNQRLEKGKVYLEKNELASMMENAIKDKIKEGLPISRKDLPAEVVSFYKENPFTVRVRKSVVDTGKSRGWIERLLEYPILDGRHRVVNLILAPYFVNVRKLEIDDAVKRISEYIEKCKKANPDTRINEQYIRYQCNYAKRRGMRVLSLKRARELIGEELMSKIA